MTPDKPKRPGLIIFRVLLIISVLLLFIIILGMFTPAFAPLVAPAGSLCFVAFIVAILFGNIFAPKINGKALDKYINDLPEIKASAKVISKNTSTGSQPAFNHAQFVVVSVYDITFELAGKKRLCFKVGDAQFNTIVENDEGTLIYKEGGGQQYFLSFQPR